MYSISNVDGAKAMVFTPVRVTNRKDQDRLGSSKAITSVRRSTRLLDRPSGAESPVVFVENLSELMEVSGIYAMMPAK